MLDRRDTSFLNFRRPLYSARVSIQVFKNGMGGGRLARQDIVGGRDAAPPKPWVLTRAEFTTIDNTRTGSLGSPFESHFQNEGDSFKFKWSVDCVQPWIAHWAHAVLKARIKGK